MRQQKYLVVCGAVVASVAVLAATSYCTLEAFAMPASQSEAPHHHDGSDQHHDGNRPTPGNDDAAACCATIQAILASKLDVQFGSVTAQLFQSLALSVPWPVSVGAPFRLAAGLPPPTREPTPITSFYRTTFAAHAPPTLLA